MNLRENGIFGRIGIFVGTPKDIRKEVPSNLCERLREKCIKVLERYRTESSETVKTPRTRPFLPPPPLQLVALGTDPLNAEIRLEAIDPRARSSTDCLVLYTKEDKTTGARVERLCNGENIKYELDLSNRDHRLEAEEWGRKLNATILLI